jgi:pimeloyl-ACP methyl ester carboxylesterase
MALPFQLFLLPGLGADARLFEPQRRAFPDLIVPPWIPPNRQETLHDYAIRMAETIRPLSDVPFVLGGVSFGGMMALEMARYLKPDAVVMIASCRSRDSLCGIHRLGRRVVPWLPSRTWNVLQWISPWVTGVIGKTSPADRKQLVRMFREIDFRFMHWTLQAILGWEATPLMGTRVYQIHGGRDPLIPACRVTADEMIPDGSHMINMTHADRVNAFIARVAECRR